jgi:hypothetical protein
MLVDTQLVVSINVVKNFVNGGISLVRIWKMAGQHVEAFLDVYLGQEAPIGHPSSNEEILDEVVW